MELTNAFDELQLNLEEIQKQHRLIRLRKFLRFLLVGFLIGRDSRKRIEELTVRNSKIIDELLNQLEGLKNIEQCIAEFSNAYSRLAQLEERIRANTLPKTEFGLENYHQVLVTYAGKAIEKKEQAVKKLIEGIVNSGTYLIYSDRRNCSHALDSIQEDLNHCEQSNILDSEYIKEKKKTLEEHRTKILNYNRNFINQRKEACRHLWNKGLLSLDDEQQTAIVTDDKYNLVVAAAGSGKTEVLITRIAYLTARNPDGITPHRILAIAYQNKDVKQIQARLDKQYGITGVNVKTLHGLGIEVLKRAGEMKKILDKNERPRIIKSIYQHKLEFESDFNQAFLDYVKSLHESKMEENLADKVTRLQMKKRLPYTSIDDTKVQSRAEKEILDFLLTSKINGAPVKVEYEPETRDLGRPDFYLPEYDLFIENWGLTKNGEVPEWFGQSTVEYKENMERKKSWFAENNKSFVETFAHEYDEEHPEIFIQMLKDRIVKKLEENRHCDFHFDTMNYPELIKVVCESDRDWVSEDRVSTDIFNFIKNAKTYNLKPERISEKLESGKYSRKQRTFGKLAVEVYKGYQEKLRELQKIDFEDMINQAISELDKNEKLCNNFLDHILIDEYQDITQQTHMLVKHLLDHNRNCKLFCVGDDWQSIMGFAGSNVEFLVNFEKYFENPAITHMSTNYRSVATIVDAGARLISNNRNHQIAKRTVSKNKTEEAIRILRSPHKISYRRNYHKQVAADCISRVAEYLKRGYASSDILILSRFMHVYAHQAPRLHYMIENILEEAEDNGIKLSPNARTTRGVRVLTVHKAKGLEAKVVFVLNVIKDTYGFPCEIEDSSILEPARENYPHQDQKEEERRLFYVAMARAMEDLYIYTWEPARSEFIDEIAGYTIEERLSY
jgi:DNA helicase-4